MLSARLRLLSRRSVPVKAQGCLDAASNWSSRIYHFNVNTIPHSTTNSTISTIPYPHYQRRTEIDGIMASTQTPAQKPAEQAQAPQKDQKATPALEEDDEFEDFPVGGTYCLTSFSVSISASKMRHFCKGRMVFKVEAHVLVASSSATLQCRVTRSGWTSRRLGCSQNAYIAKMIRYVYTRAFEATLFF